MLILVWELWFGGSILQTQKQCLLMVISMGSTAGNQCGMSWLMLESLLKLSLLQLEGRYLDTCSTEGPTCCQRWLGTASQRKRSVVFSSYWSTTMPDAERVSAFYKWRKKQYVLDHILNWQKSMICFIKASSRSNTHWFHSNCFRSLGVIPVYTLWEFGTSILKGN